MSRRSSEADSATDYHFVTVTSWTQRSSSEIQRIIRSQAMRDFRRRSRRRRPPAAVREPADHYLDGSSLLRADTRFGSLLDPFYAARYPGPIDPRAWELIHHAYGDSCGMFKAMRDVGFFQIMADSAGFHLILSSAAWHMAQLRHLVADDNVEFAFHAHTGIQLVNQSLADDTRAISDETISNVLALVCHANMTENVGSFNLHIAGLQEVIRRRGSLLMLQQNSLLRLVIFWADVNGAMAQDTVPRFAPPTDLLPTRPPLFRGWTFHAVIENPAINTRDFLSAQSAMVELFHDMYGLTTTIVTHSASNIWTDAIFPGMHISPLVHRLLTLDRAHPPFGRLSPTESIQEACRLASLLYLGQLRRRFGFAQIPSALYVCKLRALLIESRLLDWDPFNLIYLWVLVMGGTCSGFAPVQERQQFAQLLVIFMRAWNIHRFDQVIGVVKGFLWVDDAFSHLAAGFQDEVEARVARQTGQAAISTTGFSHLCGGY